MKISANTIWAAIDNIATKNNISCSHMAKISDLDPTIFNKSKRVNQYGKPHWPSAETLTKMMRAMNISWIEFADYFPPEESEPQD